jgi:predicted RNA methylase
MVECFKPRNNNVVDLGSGLGIPTFVAQLCGFQATGIELNSDLHQAATHLAGIFPGLPELRQTQIVSADFRKFNLAAFGIVYAYLWDNCLQLDVMQRTLDRLPEGTIVITYGLNSIRLDDPMRKQCDDKRNLLPIFTEETDALRRLRFHQI